MRIAVLSDTHGNYPLAVRALDHLGDFDHIIHLGDTSDDAEIIEAAIGRKLIIVSGNCDSYKQYPRSMSLEIAGKNLLISHGDLFHVKAGLSAIHSKAMDHKADIVLYGHTHKPSVQEINGVLFMNPGTMKHCADPPSLGVLVIKGGSISAEIVDASTFLPAVGL